MASLRELLLTPEGVMYSSFLMDDYKASYADIRDLGDGRTLYLERLTFGRLRICLGRTGDETGYYDGW